MARRILFSAVAFFLTILMLEGAARLFEIILKREYSAAPIQPGWQAEFFKSFLDWHQPDPDLLWRFKAGLDNPLIETNSDHLLGPEIVKPKPPRTFRILLLGDSSPVGLGLKSRREAFGEILKVLLDMQYAGWINIDLVNAAVSGYSSAQIDRFLELKGWRYQPDLVLLYCGNNDASISGIFSDRDLMNEQRLKSLRRFLSHLALYRVVKSLLVTEVPKTAVRPSDFKVRVTAEEYGQNLHYIYKQCRTHDCPLVILKPPVPLFWPAGLQFKLFTHTTGADGQLIMPEELSSILGRKLKYCLDENRFREIYGKGDIFTRNVYQSAYTDSLSPDSAIKYYQSLLKTDSSDPVLFNNLGVSYWQNGSDLFGADYFHLAEKEFRKKHPGHDPATLSALSPFIYNDGIDFLSGLTRQTAVYSSMKSIGLAILDSALQCDYLSLRIKRSYLNQIDNIQSNPGITIIDLPRIFQQNGGETLFIDHCHPTAAGHRLIADALFKTIVQSGIIKAN